jgi:hypothetical protein
MPISSVLEWLANTDFAIAIQQSPAMGALSSVHLVGLTLITGSAMVVCLRCFGFLLPEQPLAEVLRPAWKVILLGFAISLTSGALMFMPRAVAAAGNSAFRVKMILVLAAVVFHFTLYRSVTRSGASRPPWFRLTGALGAGLWFAIGVCGCLFAIFE